ncbi:hypothetical protein RJ639_026983 [Escallonia herrerae]|uniref:Polysaccharide biosynthesis domain-containing protein n=1 Tax=Escallonia herrerae TaxID=1293975 RepID=A0AA88X659_9ASTE|nr:hypothetical protein RJ639_026983 [Escallonia herrerae]
MNATKKKLIPILVFILTGISLLRLLKITINTSSSPPAALPPPLVNACPYPSPACDKFKTHKGGLSATQPLSSLRGNITEQEMQFLSSLVSHRAPCNLLIFGLKLQYLVFSVLNAGGTTVFLEDNPNKVRTIRPKSNNTRVYKVEYNTTAKEAYKLLKHARKNPACSPNTGLHEVPRCELALTDLPKKVYKLKWDIVIVDGPSGNGPEAPGRMAAIYTASILARTGKMTDIVVHDVDRMIEKWFSWEFLCDDNIVSSKGKFWDFRVAQKPNSKTFCPVQTSLVLE